jgi:hypothetical protein
LVKSFGQKKKIIVADISAFINGRGSQVTLKLFYYY